MLTRLRSLIWDGHRKWILLVVVAVVAFGWFSAWRERVHARTISITEERIKVAKGEADSAAENVAQLEADREKLKATATEAQEKYESEKKRLAQEKRILERRVAGLRNEIAEVEAAGREQVEKIRASTDDQLSEFVDSRLRQLRPEAFFRLSFDEYKTNRPGAEEVAQLFGQVDRAEVIISACNGTLATIEGLALAWERRAKGCDQALRAKSDQVENLNELMLERAREVAALRTQVDQQRLQIKARKRKAFWQRGKSILVHGVSFGAGFAVGYASK